MTASNLVRKGFISLTDPSSSSSPKATRVTLTQRRILEARADAVASEDWCLLACSSWLAQLACFLNSAMFITGFLSFLYNPNGAVIYNTLMLSVIFFWWKAITLFIFFTSVFFIVWISWIVWNSDNRNGYNNIINGIY